MKKITIMLISMLSIATLTYATESKSQDPSYVSASPQVCQFSLSKYTGTIDGAGNTNSFTVGLSCPQEETIYATVGVVIDGEIVASKVVEIDANKTKSSSTYINVGTSYSGQKYSLMVQ